MNDAKNESMLTWLGQSAKNAFHTLVRLLDAQRKAMSQAVRFMLRALLVGLMAIYAAGIGHATIVPIPIDDDLSIYIPCTDVSGSTETGGVTVTATPGRQSAVSDASGNYKLLCLPIGTYTLTPTKPATTFVPASRLVSVPTAEDITIANISFNFGRTISGNVGIDGATITLMNGSLVVGTTTSDINGNYSFGSVGPGTFTLSVSKDRATFSPASQTVAVTVGGATTVNASFALASAYVPGVTAGQFSVSPGGAATYSIPIQVPPGTAGMQPGLSLSYSSQQANSNSLVGVGWALSGLSVIHRCSANFTTDGPSAPRGVNYTINDKFCMDGQRLVVVAGVYGAAGSEYRTEKESFTKVVAEGVAGNGPASFVAYLKSGQIVRYGNTTDSRIMPIINGAVGITPRVWAVRSIEDRFTNNMTLTYIQDQTNGAYYPVAINYTANTAAGTTSTNSVIFTQEPRSTANGDQIEQYVGTAKIKYVQRLANIETYVSGALVKRYTLTYDVASHQTNRSRLKQVRECGGDGVTCLPETVITYTDGSRGIGDADNRTLVAGTTNAFWLSNFRILPGDFDGDGKSDLFLVGTAASYFCPGGQIAISNNCSQSIVGDFKTYYRTIVGDFDGDSIPDIYFTGTRSYFCSGKSIKSNQLATCVQTSTTGIFPSASPTSEVNHVLSGDVNGDGYQDIMVVQPSLNGNISLNTKITTCLGPTVTTTFLTGCTIQNYSLPQISTPGSPTNTLTSVVIIGDFDGDQIDELVLKVSGGAGSWPNGFSAAGSYVCRGTAGCTPITTGALAGGGFNIIATKNARSGDFNGDGYVDLLVLSQFNTGNWKFCPGPSALPGTTCIDIPRLSEAGMNRISGVALGDFNGDGLTDLVFSDDPLGVAGTRYCQAPGFTISNNCLALVKNPPGLWFDYADGANTRIPFSGDFDGDGVTDLMVIANQQVEFSRGGNGAADLAISFKNGLTAETKVTYDTLASSTTSYVKGVGAVFPAVDVAIPLNVVINTKSPNGLGGESARDFRYYHARGHLRGRGFLGFGRIVSTENYSPTGSHSTDTWFYANHNNFACLGAPTDVYKQASFGGFKTYNAVTNSYLTLSTGAAQHCYLATATEYNYEPSVAANPLTTQFQVNNSEVDSYGNVQKIEVTSNDGYKKTTFNRFDNTPSTWILGRLSCSAVTNTKPDLTAQTRTSSFVYRTEGSLNREIVEPGVTCGTAPAASTDPRFRVITDYGYDSWGNQNSSTVSSAVVTTDIAYFAPRTTTTTYDTRGQFPLNSVNALGHQEDYLYDGRFGNRTYLNGPNLIATNWTFDLFGRAKTETRGDGTSTQKTYSFVSPTDTAPFMVRTDSTGAPSQFQYIDLVERAYREEVQGFAGGANTVPKFQDFDALGRVITAYRPSIGSTLGKATNYEYDNLGRMTKETRPDTGVTDIVFLGPVQMANAAGVTVSTIGMKTTVSGPNTVTQTSITYTDSQGKTIVSVNGDTAAHESVSQISYAYNHFGNLINTKDSAGNIVQMTYDLRGRKDAMTDPDMGLWTYKYDALGQLKEQSDPVQRATLKPVTTMTYDPLGRMVSRVEPDYTSNWFYDAYKGGGACNKGKGKLCQVETTTGYNRTYTYDSVGRPSQMSYTVGHATQTAFVVDTAYDSAGRVDSLTYPAVTVAGVTTRLKTKNKYNASGYLYEIADDATNQHFWRGTVMDAEGHFTTEELGLNTTIRTFDPNSGRMTAINTGGSTKQNMTFTYDTIGNLKARTDVFNDGAPTTVNESFVYDALNRLKSMSMSGTTTLAKTYNYNAIGNLIYKSDVGTLNYVGPRPHAVTSVTGTIAGVFNPANVYDANGNMTSAMNGTRAIEYTNFNQVKKITNGGVITQFNFDPDHQRVKEITTKGTIWFINAGNMPLFERHDGFNQAGYDVMRHFIQTPSGTTAVYIQKTNNTKETHYLHKDHLGSTTAITSATGALVQRLSYDPFGRPRNVNGTDTPTNLSPDVRRGFTGHEMLPDAGGLIHMNGRIYDPQLGRFLSADFIVPNDEHTESYNRYSYVFNNPLSLTDPDGQCPVCAIVVVIIGGAATYSATTIAASIVLSSFFGMMAAAVATEGDPKAMLQGAVSGALFAWIGGVVQPGASGVLSGGQIAAKIAVHAVAGGLINSAFGGDFRSGALAAGFGAAIGSIKGLQITKNTDPGIGKVISVGVIRTVAGGIGAELGGGKFVNGAATAAFAYLFNDLPHSGWASEPKSYSKTFADADQAGDFYAREGCGSKTCQVIDSSVNLIVDGARASSRDSEMRDWGVNVVETIIGGNPIPLSKKDWALLGIDKLTNYQHKLAEYGVGEKPLALMANDIVIRHTAQNPKGYGQTFTYTQILRQEYKNPELWTRFRY